MLLWVIGMSLHHLLVNVDFVRFEAHLRNSVCAGNQPFLIVLVRVDLRPCWVWWVHVLLHALICIESLVLLLVWRNLLVVLNYEIAIPFNACLPRLSLIWSLSTWVRIPCQVIDLSRDCIHVVLPSVRIQLDLIVLLLMAHNLFLLVLDELVFLIIKAIRITLQCLQVLVLLNVVYNLLIRHEILVCLERIGGRS